MAINIPAGDLARIPCIEPDETWPTMIEIVAYFGETRKGKRRFVQINADAFFGRNGHGAPMTGEQLIGIIDRLRRKG